MKTSPSLCLVAFSTLTLLSLSSGVAAAQPRLVPFEPATWDLSAAQVTQHLGREALTGAAWLKGVEFQDGIIEVDIATGHERCYPMIVFRRQAPGEYEHVYFRPHRTIPLADGIQYAPVFNGVTGWQLYSGPGFIAPITLPQNQWVHVRIEVKGTQARMFVGDAATPAIEISELKRGGAKGSLGVDSPLGGGFYYSRFSYTPTSELAFDPPPPRDPLAGVITNWMLSPAVPYSDLGTPRYLDGAGIGQISWQPVQSEASGLLDIARYRKPVGRAWKAWLRATIHADTPLSRPLSFGYSDDVAVYLNGQLLFRGRSGFLRRDPSFQGVIGWNDTVYLPLQAGDNELVLEVVDSFGGWGAQARLADTVYQRAGVQKEWETGDGLRAPESAVFDSERGVFYVSNFSNDGFISQVAADGRVLVARWVTGLKMPAGLRLQGRRLYAVDRSGLNEIDVPTGQVVARTPVAGARFLNDLAIAEDGSVYLTDSFADTVYRVRDGRAELWLQDPAIANPNGIVAEKERLLVGVTSSASIQAVDLATKKVTRFGQIAGPANMDGLVVDGHGGYLFSDYYGRIYHADAQGRTLLLFDGVGAYQHCADFEYVPAQRLLVLPSLFDDRLTAYRLPDGR